MNGQLAVAIEVAETPRANQGGEAWKFLIGERWTKADILPELALPEAGNASVSTIDAQNPGLTTVTSEISADQGAGPRIIRPVEFREVTFHKNRGVFTTLQRWEGSVIHVGAESFTARLSDRTANRADEEGEFSLEEVSLADRELVTGGAVFYWSVGYLDHRSGQRTRESLIRFRRLPAWNKRELDEARQRAREILDGIGSAAWRRAT